MTNYNINFDPSKVPGWLIAVLIAASLAAELITSEAPPRTGLEAGECFDMCGGEVGAWTPYICECKQDRPNAEG